MQSQVAVLLHNVRSTHNVGSIFRTADAAGVSRVFLSGYTPKPVDRFGRVQKDIAKTALGAERFLTWEYVKNIKNQISKLKSEGWTIVGVEQDKRSKDYRDFHRKAKTLYIFGNEVLGMSKSLRDACDVLIEIPMHGKKESLNVSVTAGIVLFQVTSK
jgi:tRNA G18 (ribose-2'-O)-methylase SpoU